MDYLQGQSLFSRGELSPTMYARTDTSFYGRGAKIMQNILPIPQGGARKRFGTVYRSLLTQTNYEQIYPTAYEFSNQCIYQVIFYNNAIDIYLEGELIATVSSTGIDGDDINLIDETILENRLRITVGFQAPRDLIRSASTPNAITAISTGDDTLTITTPITLNTILPVTFATTGSLPTTIPQIKIRRIYFIRALTTTTVAIYKTATDARDDLNRFQVTVLGASSTMVAQNNWTFNAVVFKNKPVYDFDGGYDALTFTPGATTGSTSLTASGAIFTTAMIGGLFYGNGGIARITAFTSATVVTILIEDDFASTSAIPGQLSLLTEPAWSDERGWPQVCGSYQNRAIFGCTDSLPNGLWCSAINDYEDYDDSTLDDDQAISWYPTSDVGNTIQFISPYRSLVVHTDTGVFSTPMQQDVAITPRNFSLALQDNTPSANIQPVTIDNQLMVISGRDVNSLIWEFGNSAYVPNLISASAEHLIKVPVSMAPFRDRTTEGGRYLFIINSDGTMAMYQTLLSEEIAGWTWADTTQSYGTSYFRKVISSVLGRCWFIVQRDVAAAAAPIALTAFSSVDDTLTAAASNFSTTVPTAVLFTTATSLPTTTPQIDASTYYFVMGVTANTFKVYATQEDAIDDANAFEIASSGTAANVVAYTLTARLVMEELSYAVRTDCTFEQSGTNLTQATGLTLFNAQTVTLKADGRVYDTNPVLAGIEQVTIMGDSAEVDEIQTGYKINFRFEPLPISVNMGPDPRTSNIASPKHIRFVYLMCVDSVGGKINNQNIALKELNGNGPLNIDYFAPPTGQIGLMEVSLMAGWNQFKAPPFVITHDEPYDFNLIGLFYKLDV